MKTKLGSATSYRLRLRIDELDLVPNSPERIQERERKKKQYFSRLMSLKWTHVERERRGIEL